eukprot:9496114-Pyramimonas_sp.AAC.1
MGIAFLVQPVTASIVKLRHRHVQWPLLTRRSLPPVRLHLMPRRTLLVPPAMPRPKKSSHNDRVMGRRGFRAQGGRGRCLSQWPAT